MSGSFIYFFMFIHVFEREHARELRRGRKRGRERDSQAGPAVSIQSPESGFEFMNCEIMT